MRIFASHLCVAWRARGPLALIADGVREKGLIGRRVNRGVGARLGMSRQNVPDLFAARLGPREHGMRVPKSRGGSHPWGGNAPLHLLAARRSCPRRLRVAGDRRRDRTWVEALAEDWTATPRACPLAGQIHDVNACHA